MAQTPAVPQPPFSTLADFVTALQATGLRFHTMASQSIRTWVPGQDYCCPIEALQRHLRDRDIRQTTALYPWGEGRPFGIGAFTHGHEIFGGPSADLEEPYHNYKALQLDIINAADNKTYYRYAKGRPVDPEIRAYLIRHLCHQP